MVRLGLLVVYFGLMGFVFVTGKGHTLILDNKDSADGSIKAIESLSISVDGQDPIDLSAGDRDMAKVKGQGHKVVITVKDSQMVQHRLTLPLEEETLLLSIPKLLAGQPAVIPFVPLDVAPPAGETNGNNNAFTSPDAVPDAAAVPGAPGAPAVPGAPTAPGAPAAPAVP
jgi:hypothetical protein